MEPVTAVAIIWAPTTLLGYRYYIGYRKHPQTSLEFSPLDYLNAAIVSPLLGTLLVIYILVYRRMPHARRTPEPVPQGQARLDQFQGRTATTTTETTTADDKDRDLTLDLDTDSVIPDDQVRDR